MYNYYIYICIYTNKYLYNYVLYFLHILKGFHKYIYTTTHTLWETIEGIESLTVSFKRKETKTTKTTIETNLQLPIALYNNKWKTKTEEKHTKIIAKDTKNKHKNLQKKKQQNYERKENTKINVNLSAI